MKQSILNRYERDDEGHIVIDVFASRVEDLYNNFDMTAPYFRRDLAQDFADYLIDCAREVGHDLYSIRFSFANPADELRISRIQRSLNSYFAYLAESEKTQISHMFRRSAILLAIGLCILFASVSLNHWLGSDRSVTANVFAEGLTIAAWVSLWEALAVFLIEWFPHRKNIALYRRLAEAKLVFRAMDDKNSKYAS